MKSLKELEENVYESIASKNKTQDPSIGKSYWWRELGKGELTKLIKREGPECLKEVAITAVEKAISKFARKLVSTELNPKDHEKVSYMSADLSTDDILDELNYVWEDCLKEATSKIKMGGLFSCCTAKPPTGGSKPY